jgi:hypothetical protein
MTTSPTTASDRIGPLCAVSVCSRVHVAISNTRTAPSAHPDNLW